jgi:hypothetical protein
MRRRTADEIADRGRGTASQPGGAGDPAPAAALRSRLRLPKGLLAVSLALALALPGVAIAEAEEASGAAPPTRILVLDGSNAPLAALLSVPVIAARPTPAQLADARIAEAVALGTRPELERKSGFRKRKFDLFRAERPVEIGEQQMVLRLRVRPKKRETMKVELRF